MNKERLDILIVERGLVESRSQAQRWIMAGQVRVDGQVLLKASCKVARECRIEIDLGQRFVSRGGEKLAAALINFTIPVDAKICADVGASTGGFTDCLLQNGALRVYAIDVGQGILHWKLRQDQRVIVMEGKNARNIDALPEPVDLITIDASFISLKILLPVVKKWLKNQVGDQDLNRSRFSPLGQVIALIKPQFEAGRKEVAHGDGVIRDPVTHQRVLDEILSFAREQGYALLGLLRSPLLGPKGNEEFLLWLGYPYTGKSTSIDELILALFPPAES